MGQQDPGMGRGAYGAELANSYGYLSRDDREMAEYEARSFASGSAQQIHELWNKIDTRRQGKISAADFHRAMAGKRQGEMRALLGDEHAGDNAWKDVLSTIDTNNDGSVSFAEFEAACKEAKKKQRL